MEATSKHLQHNPCSQGSSDEEASRKFFFNVFIFLSRSLAALWIHRETHEMRCRLGMVDKRGEK